MKKKSIKDWSKYFIGVVVMSGMLFFTACNNQERGNKEVADIENEVEAEESYLEEGIGDVETENTATTLAAEEYDAEAMGTAATNRKPMETTGQNMSQQDYEALKKKYQDVNKNIRESLRNVSGSSMEYTDNYKSADGTRGYYGVTLIDVIDENERQKIRDMIKQSNEMRNQMRGKIDEKTKVYTVAEEEAVPKDGFDKLNDFIQNKIEYPTNAQAAEIEGTIFVQFVVDKNGKVINPEVVDGITGQRQPIKTPMNPTRVGEDKRKEAIAEMNKEAVEAVEATSGMWEPAKQGGQNVAMEMTLPVRFKIADR